MHDAHIAARDAEIERGRRILEAAARAGSEGQRVVTFERCMIDAPLKARARALLSRAGDLG